VPGSIIACYTVNVKYIGRKGTMAIATVVTGIFVILFTIASDSGFQLAMSCTFPSPPSLPIKAPLTHSSPEQV
jgi:hypothetical protein